MVEYSLQGHTVERASHIYLVQERIGAHKHISYYLSGTCQLSMNCGSEPTLSDHCPKGHRVPPLLLLHERPLPALFRLLHLEWTIPFMVFCTIAKNVYVFDIQEKNASGVRRSTPPEVHQLLSAIWNYSASNLFWLTVPVWNTCRELHNSNWSRNRYFKSKHLPSRAFHSYCLQHAELFWIYSKNVVSKNC